MTVAARYALCVRSKSNATITGMSMWTVSGTNPAGQKIRANGCDFYTFRDGLVIKKDSYWKIVEG